MGKEKENPDEMEDVFNEKGEINRAYLDREVAKALDPKRVRKWFNVVKKNNRGRNIWNPWKR